MSVAARAERSIAKRSTAKTAAAIDIDSIPTSELFADLPAKLEQPRFHFVWVDPSSPHAVQEIDDEGFGWGLTRHVHSDDRDNLCHTLLVFQYREIKTLRDSNGNWRDVSDKEVLSSIWSESKDPCIETVGYIPLGVHYCDELKECWIITVCAESTIAGISKRMGNKFYGQRRLPAGMKKRAWEYYKDMIVPEDIKSEETDRVYYFRLPVKRYGKRVAMWSNKAA
jgi:hypothetical protein